MKTFIPCFGIFAPQYNSQRSKEAPLAEKHPSGKHDLIESNFALARVARFNEVELVCLGHQTSTVNVHLAITTPDLPFEPSSLRAFEPTQENSARID
ncbi:MAG: hypothetical protein AB1813_16460 [Verrucomicrobiota bacterium]